MSNERIPTILTGGHKINKMKVLGLSAALVATVATGIGVVASYSKKAEKTIQQGAQDISNKANAVQENANKVSGWKDNVEQLVKKAEASATEAKQAEASAKVSEMDAGFRAASSKMYNEDAQKAAAEKPVSETYKFPLKYESPLIEQMLPSLVKASYNKAIAGGNQKDWAVYEIAARFYVDQNIDVAPRDGNISNAELKNFMDENPDLEIIVSGDKIADEFKVEFPTESYRAKWREIRAKVDRIADLESKNRWSDIEFVRYALMPGMEKTADGKSYFTSKTYGDLFEGRVNSGLQNMGDKK